MKKRIILVLLGIFVVLVLLDNLGNGDVKESVEKEVADTVFATFANEERVNILEYEDNAMEPFISRDGQYLFWNSLNDAKNTSLFYAKRVDDLNFQFVGEVQGVNGETPHLDGVPSMDVHGNFYWVSLRGYPTIPENLQHGTFKNGAVTGVTPVQGDFYVREPGWIIMDAEISPDGELLFFVNAKFDGGAVPSKADIGVARKVGGQFLKDANSELLFKNINTKEYPEYAPAINPNGLEMSFTRLKGRQTFIYISKRSSLEEPFGTPELLNIEGVLPEAVTIAPGGDSIYYHKKVGQYFGIHRMTRVD